MTTNHKRTIIDLEDIPEEGQFPLRNVAVLQRIGNGDSVPTKTGAVRETLAAMAGSANLIQRARALKVCDDLSLAGIVKFSLAKIVAYAEAKAREQRK
jgi:hypothetical protein